ncbi:hypothetical protein Z043-116355, partial [Arapaima gigas]
TARVRCGRARVCPLPAGPAVLGGVQSASPISGARVLLLLWPVPYLKQYVVQDPCGPIQRSQEPADPPQWTPADRCV